MKRGSTPGPCRVAIAALTVLVACAPSAEQRLVDRVERAVEPTRFGFTHVAMTSAAAGCVRPFLRFRGEVDYDRRLFVASNHDDRSEVIAAMNRDDVLLSSSLFESVAARWIRIRRPVPEPLVAIVERALGPDLAPYVTASDLPPSGIATVADALQVASSVRAIEGVDTFRLTFDASTALGEIEAIDTEIDPRGQVRSLSVRPETIASDGGRGGWRITYADAAATVSIPSPEDAADATAVAPLMVRALPCQLPQ